MTSDALKSNHSHSRRKILWCFNMRSKGAHLLASIVDWQHVAILPIKVKPCDRDILPDRNKNKFKRHNNKKVSFGFFG
jgi:hypothetical protein